MTKLIALAALLIVSSNARAQDVYSCKAESGNPIEFTIDGAKATVAMNGETENCEAETSADEIKSTNEYLSSVGYDADVVAGVTCKGNVAAETVVYVINSKPLSSASKDNTVAISSVVGPVITIDCQKR